MRDLTHIRKQTFKAYAYSTPTPTTLPIWVSTPKPSNFRGVEEGLQHWKNRVPEGFSSPSKESYGNWLTGIEEAIASGQLIELDLQTARRQVEESKKRASRSRARLQFGGEHQAAHAHKLRAQKAERQAQKLAAKEARVARQALNQARNRLLRAGIKARKEERARKKMITRFHKKGSQFLRSSRSQFLTQKPPKLRATSRSGDANNFYNHGQLLPENFIETAKSKGYDHNYFFMH
ncbi:hypothetical protein VC83_05203 [Pseudogymnoascus destructans]|uniref:Uncharacterized protein n=1 Tax=Pseudogymnoascus destructans TaxID=655981 RepID=A0A177A700_9PEZI|nr:uncharacterized protein VC83_05203 [Pseudogymnoascus destructans]OAF57916.1 hypothetical protein VC83_05203 [Pseudogymnoascus destructans]